MVNCKNGTDLSSWYYRCIGRQQMMHNTASHNQEESVATSEMMLRLEMSPFLIPMCSGFSGQLSIDIREQVITHAPSPVVL